MAAKKATKASNGGGTAAEMTAEEIRAKLYAPFDGMSGKNSELASRLCDELAFMAVELRKLKVQISDEGSVITETGSNGQPRTKEHPAIKVYNTLIRNYNGMMSTLIRLLGNSADDTADELMQFIGMGGGKR